VKATTHQPQKYGTPNRKNIKHSKDHQRSIYSVNITTDAKIAITEAATTQQKYGTSTNGKQYKHSKIIKDQFTQ
jgi:hypothetical protein